MMSVNRYNAFVSMENTIRKSKNNLECTNKEYKYDSVEYESLNGIYLCVVNIKNIKAGTISAALIE